MRNTVSGARPIAMGGGLAATWRRSLSVCLGALTMALVGCAMPVEESESEEVGVVQQNILIDDWWATVFQQKQTLGIAINSSNAVYTWSSLTNAQGLGMGCIGFIADLCATRSFLYTSAVPVSLIRGVGIGANDGKVYAWYKSGVAGSWSKGVSTNLGALQPFLPPPDVDIDWLIDAEQTSGGTWHYFWRMPNGDIRLSQSKSPASGGALFAQKVNGFPSNTFDIAGIGALTGSSPNHIVTWWQSDVITHQRPLSWSTNSLDLLQQ